MMSNTGAVCWSSLQQRVTHGQYFTPIGKDVCEKCKCLAGKAVGCFFQTCPQLPSCDKYEAVKGACCEFECLGDKGLSNKTELAVLFSLSTGLVLLLIILISVLYCRRQGIKKSQEAENKTKTVTEQTQSNSVSGAVASNAESHQGHVELPPPYSPAPLTNPGNKIQRRTPPNEPPPPYADREESAV